MTRKQYSDEDRYGMYISSKIESSVVQDLPFSDYWLQFVNAIWDQTWIDLLSLVALIWTMFAL